MAEDYVASDLNPVTLLAAEEDFLTGPKNSETSWHPGDDAVERATQPATIAKAYPSMFPTPPSPACC